MSFDRFEAKEVVERNDFFDVFCLS